jgi:hypothetical protein
VWAWRFRESHDEAEDVPGVRVPDQTGDVGAPGVAIAQLNRGEVKPAPVAVTMGELIERYRKDYLPDLAKSTQDTDGSMLKVHFEPRWANTQVVQICVEDVETRIKTLQGKDGKPLSPASKGRPGG